ncbi:MAG: alpha-ribazole phosphatase [Chitinophagaceae bacterium]|nr:alpha-ribazole phosphatase [Chitinophagaceae bacterium]
MAIYLIRHTTPDIPKGICYGQTDLDVVHSFEQEVALTKAHLPEAVTHVFSSPLQRCHKLARALYPQQSIVLKDELKELHCGSWEMQEWNAIPKAEIQPWMDDFVHVRVPGGESYVDLHTRVVRCFENIASLEGSSVIVAHGGPLRSILSHITQTPLKESFDVFTLHYGCVVELHANGNGFEYQLLYNHSQTGKEWHRPTL